MSVDTLNADLATLRDYLAAPASAVTRTEGRAALGRVEAELARLTDRRSRYAEARYQNCMEALSAAEARCARLQQALEDVAEGLTNPTPADLWRRIYIAREALAGTDTPADSQEPPAWETLHDGVLDLIDRKRADSHYRERPIEEDFYLDPRGEWVYRWSDERRVLKLADSQEDKT